MTKREKTARRLRDQLRLELSRLLAGGTAGRGQLFAGKGLLHGRHRFGKAHPGAALAVTQLSGVFLVLQHLLGMGQLLPDQSGVVSVVFGVVKAAVLVRVNAQRLHGRFQSDLTLSAAFGGVEPL